MVAPENRHKWGYWLCPTGLLGGPVAVFLGVYENNRKIPPWKQRPSEPACVPCSLRTLESPIASVSQMRRLISTHGEERWGLALCVSVYDIKLREGFAVVVVLFFKHLAKRHTTAESNGLEA